MTDKPNNTEMCPFWITKRHIKFWTEKPNRFLGVYKGQTIQFQSNEIIGYTLLQAVCCGIEKKDIAVRDFEEWLTTLLIHKFVRVIDYV